jgi:DNA-damage-inducible protein J
MNTNDVLCTKIGKKNKQEILCCDPLKPNKETLAAMEKARKGKLKSFDSINELMAELNKKI